MLLFCTEFLGIFWPRAAKIFFFSRESANFSCHCLGFASKMSCARSRVFGTKTQSKDPKMPRELFFRKMPRIQTQLSWQKRTINVKPHTWHDRYVCQEWRKVCGLTLKIDQRTKYPMRQTTWFGCEKIVFSCRICTRSTWRRVSSVELAASILVCVNKMCPHEICPLCADYIF